MPLVATAAAGNAGNVDITVGGDIVAGDGEGAIQIDTSSVAGDAGDIALAAGGNIISDEIVDTSSTGGDGGISA